MRHRARKSMAAALAVILFFGLSDVLSSKGRSGADLLITLKDGSKYRGELIAVRPDSLLLLDHRTGKTRSPPSPISRPSGSSRKSKAWQGLLIGLVPGAVGGAALGAHASAGDDPELGAFAGGVVVGGIAGLVGLAAGFAAGLDADFSPVSRKAKRSRSWTSSTGGRVSRGPTFQGRSARYRSNEGEASAYPGS